MIQTQPRHLYSLLRNLGFYFSSFFQSSRTDPFVIPPPRAACFSLLNCCDSQSIHEGHRLASAKTYHSLERLSVKFRLEGSYISKMPPQQQVQLQWKGPPVPRAKPIPQEKWEEHKEELCELYQRMTLEDLMAMMKVRHSFAPS